MNEKNIVESLRSLHDLSKAINSSLDIDEVVAMIIEKTARLTGSDKVLLLLLEEDKTTLTLYESMGLDEADLAVREFQHIHSFDHCIVHKGTVITMDEVLSEYDRQALRRIMPFLFEMFFAPLEIKGEPYGLIGVAGGAHEFSTVDLEIFCSLGSQAAVAMENASLYRKLQQTFLHTAEALAEAINSRDPYTGGHVQRVGNYALQVGKSLDLSGQELGTLQLAAILHDIGKIGIDDAILRKVNKLSPDEKEKMNEHPEIGARILRHVKEMSDVIPGVRHHHEWYDGSGYPDGLRGERIPLAARIIAIVDVYDALTTDRPYRKALLNDAALKRLAKDADSHFDPSLLHAFCVIMGFPQGEDFEAGV